MSAVGVVSVVFGAAVVVTVVPGGGRTHYVRRQACEDGILSG